MVFRVFRQTLFGAPLFRSSFLALALIILLTASSWGQVVQFRLETADLEGNPIDSLMVGDDFLFRAYVQQVGGWDDPDKSGVFAGYLDVNYAGELASVAGDTTHGANYSNGKSGDFASGVMDNIGGFASSTDPLNILPEPVGLDEQFLFSVPMRADAVGLLTLTGADSGSSPLHDVLVWTSDMPVAAKDIDFGEVDLRLDFGQISLDIMPVPEPHSGVFGLLAIGLLFSAEGLLPPFARLSTWERFVSLFGRYRCSH